MLCIISCSNCWAWNGKMDGDILSMNHCARRRCESWKVSGGRRGVRAGLLFARHARKLGGVERVRVSAKSELQLAPGPRRSTPRLMRSCRGDAQPWGHNDDLHNMNCKLWARCKREGESERQRWGGGEDVILRHDNLGSHYSL